METNRWLVFVLPIETVIEWTMATYTSDQIQFEVWERCPSILERMPVDR